MEEVPQLMIVPSGVGSSQSPLDMRSEGNLMVIGADRWLRAERVTEEIMAKFRPTVMTEAKRSEVIGYLEGLLRYNFGCDVLSYGSFPLKTYLPDGDIDLTVIRAMNDDLVNNITSLLEAEATHNLGKFVVKDVQLINAGVKIVKTIINDFTVDISINQVGGICSLCFLEKIDRVIGRNHVFKESVILIKAWCYYESRTLGAHAGLISTYGLEILVLYIFNVFHATLNNPLSVLYKFLEYFSTFDWDNYCISLIGPVKISTLPEIITEKPLDGHDLLLDVDFINTCREAFSDSTRYGRDFSLKHINIIDPLKGDNNLGRSITKGNSIRIRSAFAYGARNLRRILTEEDNIAGELRRFFSTTVRLNNGGRRRRDDNNEHPSVENRSLGNPSSSDSELSFYIGRYPIRLSGSQPLDLTGDFEGHLACLQYARDWHTNALPPLLPMPFFATVNPIYVGFPSHLSCYPPTQIMYWPPFGPQPLVPIPCLPMERVEYRRNHRAMPPARGSHFSADHRWTRNRDVTSSFVCWHEPVPFRPRTPFRNRPHHRNRPPPADQRQRFRPVSRMHRVRLESTYRLRDEVDFPPLPS